MKLAKQSRNNRLTKNGLIVSFLLLLLNSSTLYAQNNPAPPGIPFQAFVRDLSGNIAQKREVIVIATILDGSPSGPVVLKEQFKATTDAEGVFSIILGQGILLGGTPGDLSKIDWTKGLFFLNIQTAVPTSVTMPINWDYTQSLKDMGTTQFWSVPYALNSGGSLATAITGAKALTGDKFLKVKNGDSVLLRAASLSLNTDSLNNYIGKGILKDTAANLRSLINTQWSTKGNAATTATNFIGTTDAQPLTIKTNNTSALTITTDQKLGIGMATPKSKLEINSSRADSAGLRFTMLTAASKYTDSTTQKFLSVDGLGNVILAKLNSGTAFYAQGGNNDAGSNKDTAIWRNGNIGIGTNNPNTKLEINSNKTDTAGLRFTKLSNTSFSQTAAVPFSSTTAWATTGTAPYGIAIDGAGNVYTANQNTNTVTKITSTGAVTTLWATTGIGPTGIAVDGAGNVYTANNNGTITKITSTGTVTTPWATTGSAPQAIAIDESGNVYTVNLGSRTVTKILPGGGAPTIIAATGANPYGIAVDGAGNVYTTNYNANTVTKITSTGTVITAWATLPANSGPHGIAIDAAGNVYTANDKSNTVIKIPPVGGIVTTPWATTGRNPRGIVIDAAGNVYTTNYFANTVTKITPAGSPSTLSATGTNPTSIAIDAAGNVYTANSSSNDVTKITPAKAAQNLASQFLTVNSSGDVLLANASIGTGLPAQSGNAGKVLTTDGTAISWRPGLPTQSGNAGKVLTTDGTTTSWQTSSGASQLELITEGENTGWRILGRDADNYGDIGNGAIDLSYSDAASATMGATGSYATALGQNTTAKGSAATAMGLSTNADGETSTAMGYSTTAEGWYSTAIGYESIAKGWYSTAMGNGTISEGRNSTAMGRGSIAKSFAETVVGSYNTGYKLSEFGATSFDPSDRAFVVGIGSSIETKKDGLIVWKDGSVGIGLSAKPTTALEVNGAISNSIAYNASMDDATIDFSKSNLAHTESSAETFTLTNIKTGGVYTLIVEYRGGRRASFLADGFTFLYADTPAIINEGDAVLYSFYVVDTTVYTTMAKGF